MNTLCLVFEITNLKTGDRLTSNKPLCDFYKISLSDSLSYMKKYALKNNKCTVKYYIKTIHNDLVDIMTTTNIGGMKNDSI